MIEETETLLADEINVLRYMENSPHDYEYMISRVKLFIRAMSEDLAWLRQRQMALSASNTAVESPAFRALESSTLPLKSPTAVNLKTGLV